MGGNATMFGVNFIDGRIKGYPYATPTNDPKTFYVHCVTGNANYGINDYSDNGDGTVRDLATGLMWEQDDYQSSDFNDAVDYCENATTAGHDDWRLPNVKELHSIVDYDRAPDYTDSAAIDPVFSATSITNENGVTDWGYYWSSTTHENYTGIGRNGAYISFGRAVGYYMDPQTQMVNYDDVHGAGAQRSNDKTDISSGSSANLGYGSFYYHGPQGDILRLDNMVRCVRDDDTVNAVPEVTTNTGLTITTGDTGAVIYSSMLETTDADHTGRRSDLYPDNRAAVRQRVARRQHTGRRRNLHSGRHRRDRPQLHSRRLRNRHRQLHLRGLRSRGRRGHRSGVFYLRSGRKRTAAIAGHLSQRRRRADRRRHGNYQLERARRSGKLQRALLYRQRKQLVIYCHRRH